MVGVPSAADRRSQHAASAPTIHSEIGSASRILLTVRDCVHREQRCDQKRPARNAAVRHRCEATPRIVVADDSDSKVIRPIQDRVRREFYGHQVV